MDKECIGIIVNLALVLTTIFMAVSAYKLSKKTLFGKAEILTRGWKIVESPNYIKGSLVTVREARKEKIKIKPTSTGYNWENALRFCIYLKQSNEYNNIQKVKINSVKLLTYQENEIDIKIPSFFEYQEYETNDKGYESAEYLGYYNNRITKTTKKKEENNEETETSIEEEKEAYRIHIVLKFLNKKQAEKFLKYISENEYIFKINLSLVNNAKIRATYNLNLANNKLKIDDSDKEKKKVSMCKYSYITDLEVKFKHFWN